jgi:hypothetical protein
MAQRARGREEGREGGGCTQRQTELPKRFQKPASLCSVLLHSCREIPAFLEVSGKLEVKNTEVSSTCVQMRERECV